MDLRLRARFAALAVGTIVIGLAVHWSDAFHGATQDVLGDALWAAMMVWWISALAPHARLIIRCAVALCVCFMVELSQLVHTLALDRLRSSTLGNLVLGSGFDPRDLVAYTIGVGAAFLFDRFLTRISDER